MKDWASNAFPDLDLKVETEKFLDWHGAKGSSFADWDKAWKGWIRKANEISRSRKEQVSKSGNGCKPDTVGAQREPASLSAEAKAHLAKLEDPFA
jgi:hypothetical protein